MVSFLEGHECILLGMDISEVVCNVAQRMCVNIGQLKGRAVAVVVLRYPFHCSLFCSSHATGRIDLSQG